MSTGKLVSGSPWAFLMLLTGFRPNTTRFTSLTFTGLTA
ncbi:Uncharacterised protein [Salmonella enterica subsp. enterica serovar Typhi]|nr:Uncharacterised protein [Salmonella enterica subsp. enterica serovar Typhi]